MPTLDTLVDDFNGEFDWVTWEPSWGVTLVDGRAQLTSDPSYYTLQTNNVWTLTGCRVIARIYPASGAGASSGYSSMMVESATGGTRLVIDYRVDSNSVRFGNDVGWWDNNSPTVPYDATSMAWWSIREAAGTVYLETSPDGETWTTRYQFPTPAWIADGTSKFSYQLYQDAGSSIGQIDNVNVPPAVAPEPEPDPEPGTMNADPWTLVSIAGNGSPNWTQTSGPTVTIHVDGEEANFIAPPAMTDQTIGLDNNGQAWTVNVRAALSGIKAEDGTITPIRLVEGIDPDPVLPPHNPTPTGPSYTTPVIRSQTIASVPSSTSNKSISRPSGVTAGDLLLLVIGISSGSGLVLPTGFTSLGSHALDSLNPTVIVGYKIATSSEPTSYTPTIPSGITYRGDLFRIDSFKAGTTPAVAMASSPESPTIHSIPSVTPKSPHGLLITNVSTRATTGTPTTFSWTPPSGMIEVTDNTANSLYSMSTARQEWASSSATGSRTSALTRSPQEQRPAIGVAIVVPALES